MSIKNDRQLQNTQNKLNALQSEYAKLADESAGVARARQLTLRSLATLMKQLKEEIACYQAKRMSSTRPVVE